MFLMKMSGNQYILKTISLVIVLNSFLIISINSYAMSNYSSVDYDEDKWFWNKEDYPNPYEQPPYCRRAKPSYICDPDRILKQKEANNLDDWMVSLKNVSVCYCPYCPPNEKGISLGIAIMKNIFKEYNVRELQNAEIFAEFLRKKWNFGICDNNVVIVLVTDDNQVAFAQGSVSSKNLPQFLLENIIKENQIHFIQENYYQGFENIIKSFGKILRQNIQFSASLTGDVTQEETGEEDKQNDDSSHTGLIVGLIIGFILFVTFIVFLLIYLKRRFSEDMDGFQFKGMLSKGYWLNKNERLRPVSVIPINTVGGVYEPCSIEDTNNTEADKRLRQKLSQISDESTSSDEEDIQVIEHNINNQTDSANIIEQPSTSGQTPVVINAIEKQKLFPQSSHTNI